MKKIFLLIYWLTFLMLGTIAHATCTWNDSIPIDSEYVYKVPGDIRQDLCAIETGTDPALCITSAKICSGTQISNTNLAALTTANLVDGSALYSLSSTPSGAGALPIVNGGTGQTSRQAAINALSALSLSGTSGEDLVSNGSNMVLGYPASLTIASATEGDLIYYTGSVWTRVGAGVPGQVLDTQGTVAAPIWSSTLNVVSGNVGIGSATPGQKLDVQGSIRGNQFFGDGSKLTGISTAKTLIGVWNDTTGVTGAGNGPYTNNSTVIDTGTDWAGKNIFIIATAEGRDNSTSFTTSSPVITNTSSTALSNMPYSASTISDFYFTVIQVLTLPTNSYTLLASYNNATITGGIAIGTNGSGNLVLVSYGAATGGLSGNTIYTQLSGAIFRTP